MSRGMPSMTALLGLLAVAGFQNKDKIAEWLGGLGQSGGAPGAGDRPKGLDGILESLKGTGQQAGGMLSGGLGGLVDQFRQNGHGETADSWVAQGPNKEIAAPDLARAIGPDTLDALARQTGLSRDELLARLSRELPAAVDRYTPDGRLPSAA